MFRQERFAISGFFDGSLNFWIIRLPKRIFIPLSAVLIAKVAGATFLYYWLGVGSVGTFWNDPSRVFGWEQNNILLQSFSSAGRWPYIFVGWDSAWYLSIAFRGYTFSPQSFTFSPGLPLFSQIFNLLFENPIASIAIVGLVFGILWIPLFQLLAERWISKESALLVTLIFAFSPYIFLFTTVAYAEGLFLFFTLGAWLLFNRGRVGWSAFFGFVAPLTRVMGIVVGIPMLVDSLQRKGPHWLRQLLLSLLPVVSLGLWFVAASFWAGGDVLAPVHTTEWSTLTTLPKFTFVDLPQKGLGAFSALSSQNYPASQYWLTPLAVSCALIVPLFLIPPLRKVDTGLWVYSLVFFLGILIWGSIVSAPRFVSVLFPLCLPIGTKLRLSKLSVLFVVAMSAVFFFVAVDMWASFLSGQFVA